MTDPINFYRTVISQVTAFVGAYENLLLISDRISADSSLSTSAAAAANSGGRADLTIADFDNLNNAIKSIQTRLGSNDPTVNSATVKLPLYKIL